MPPFRESFREIASVYDSVASAGGPGEQDYDLRHTCGDQAKAFKNIGRASG